MPNGASGTSPGKVAGRCSVTIVAVNAEQAEELVTQFNAVVTRVLGPL